ncbi:putative oxidoreductase-like protein [Helianthus annuus]|nr:putative oxidoreductase-like protein [Helianthus annuus]KAJ0749591.1 putative oxidoreductase-like protein [Helianthus annuus]
MTMDDSASKNKIKSDDASRGVKDTTVSKKPLKNPLSLEKPLPGDCCGSGCCVRCFWDVYYDEL